MNILYITDSKIPNNWIIRHSAIMRDKGYNTHLSHASPDEIYVSCIFKKNANNYSGLNIIYDVPIHRGGTGFNNNLDPKIDSVMPDYSLYPGMGYSLGHTSRGCPNGCHFCIVPEKEGHKTYRVQHVKDFHDHDHDKVMFLDSNILQDKDWFFSNTDYLLENNLTLLEHGMDARMLDDEICQRLKEVEVEGHFKFAFDESRNEKQIVRGMELLRKYKIRGTFYVYCHDENQIPDAIRRKEIIQKHGHDWHIMTNQEVPQTNQFKRFKRWGCRPALSRSHPFNIKHSSPIV